MRRGEVGVALDLLENRFTGKLVTALIDVEQFEVRRWTGTTGPVVVTATKANQSDVAGNVKTCAEV